MADPTTLLIAEDHAIVRDGLRRIFAEQADFAVVGEAEDGEQAVKLALKLAPDLVLLDLSMPRMNGLEALKEIKRRLPKTRVVILTVQRTEEYVFAAFESGVDGYLLKNCSSAELLLAARRALQGERYLCSQISGTVIQGFLSAGPPEAGSSACPELSAREVEVLTLVAQGRKSREIAERLFISEKTVEKHRSNVMRKLDRHTVSALTSYAIEKGLVTP